jgi:outer membrane protein assembly factor BamB
MALARGLLFVPVVDLCALASAKGYQPIGGLDPSTGTGELVALAARTGAVLWTHRLSMPDFGCATATRDVVFTSTFDGTLLGLDARTGATLWQTRLPAGINACPAIDRRTLVVGAGIGAGASVEAFGF